jgi:hypothetical protein
MKMKLPKAVRDLFAYAKTKAPAPVVILLGSILLLLIVALLWFILPKTGLPQAVVEVVKLGLALILILLLLAPLGLGVLGAIAVLLGPLGILWQRAGVRAGFAFLIGFALGILVGSCMATKGFF